MNMTADIEVFPVSTHRAKGFSIAPYGQKLDCGLAETEEIAFLVALQYKYCTSDSDFAKFACRMLDIKSAWAE